MSGKVSDTLKGMGKMKTKQWITAVVFTLPMFAACGPVDIDQHIGMGTQAGKPCPSPPCNGGGGGEPATDMHFVATLADGAGDALQSDGNSYGGSEGGVVTKNINGQFTLKVFTKQMGRTLNLQVGPADEACAEGWLTTDAGWDTLAVGDSMASYGLFRCVQGKSNPELRVNWSNCISITHVSASVWTITAPAGCMAGLSSHGKKYGSYLGDFDSPFSIVADLLP